MTTHDDWFTPAHLCAEVAQLARHFAPAGARLVEPCAGDGRIAVLLPRCEAFDIAPRSQAVREQDALQWRGDAPFFVATNVPFSLAKKLLRHWAADPMWRGAVVIMPAIAWRWTWDVPGAELVLDGNRDVKFECARTGKLRLIKTQLQVWIPGDSGEPILPTRQLVELVPSGEGHAEFVHHGASTGTLLPNGSGRPPTTVCGIRENVPGVLDAVLRLGYKYRERWARATGAPFMGKKEAEEYAEMCYEKNRVCPSES